MKIALDCRSMLLEKSLRKFLKGMIADEREADMVVTDHLRTADKPLLRIGMDDEADLKKPFSRSQLLIRLEEQFEKSRSRAMVHALVEEDEGLEERIERAVRRCVDEILQAVKEYHEKRS